MKKLILVVLMACHPSTPVKEPEPPKCQVKRLYHATPLSASLSCAPGTQYLCVTIAEVSRMDYLIVNNNQTKAQLEDCPHIEWVD